MAAVNATGNFTNYKFGTMSGTDNPFGTSAEASADMHLKMSKKIVQLTKVIYALNTKNDEHEAIVNALKEQHEKEKAKLIEDMNYKMQGFREKVGIDVEMKTRIEMLEVSVRDYEKIRRQTLGELEEYKKQAEHRESRLIAENTQRLLEMSKELLAVKQGFEKRLENFELVQRATEDEKEQALREVNLRHQREMEEMLKSKQNAEQFERLEKEYKGKLSELQKHIDAMKEEKTRLVEEYEGKLSKSKAFYEHELEALKQTNNAQESERVEMLQAELSQLRALYGEKSQELEQKGRRFLEQLNEKEEEIAELKSRMDSLHATLNDTSSSTSELNQKLVAAEEELRVLRTRVAEIQREFTISQQRCDQQAKDLMKKSSDLGTLEAIKLQHEGTIQELKSQLATLRDQIHWLQQEKNSLNNQSESMSQEQSKRIQALEQSLKDLSVEKQAATERYEKNLKKLIEEHQKEINEIRAQQTKFIDEQVEKHRQEISKVQTDADEKLAHAEKDYLQRIGEADAEYSTQRKALEAELDSVRSALSEKLTRAENEVARLSNLISESEKGLGSASSHIESLKNANRQLEVELARVQAALSESSHEAGVLKSELDKLRKLHEKTVQDAEETLKRRLAEVTHELDEKWGQTLKRECNNLRNEITGHKEDERRAALEKLSHLKEEEVRSAKSAWEARVNELLAEIDQLKKSVSSREAKIYADYLEIKSKADTEAKRLQQEMLDSASDYARKIEQMDRAQQDELERLNLRARQQMEELESRLCQKHLEDMNAQLLAHRVSVDGLKGKLAKEKEKEVQELKENQMKIIEQVKSELQRRFVQEVDQMRNNLLQQVNQARIELERVNDEVKEKDHEHRIREEELRVEKRQKEAIIENLEKEVRRLLEISDQLSKELEAKGKEILQVRSDANKDLRRREEVIIRQHQEEIANLRTDHQHDLEKMLLDFNQAQEYLKDRVAELELMLEDAERRYHDREPREEDVQAINELRNQLAHRELQMQHLLGEKKHYELELINRETNFNKIFSAAPNIGVMNPLAKKKKPAAAAGATVSMSSMAHRLEPLPGSVTHEEALNARRPLPPPQVPVKRYIK